ncbi:hypothetical protein PV355_10010 [Streptomyces stelliscabiei]|uniref:DUF6907 domain-containing protein n=1 Tax=Streptomyces stelliscabiei TaxID=146820 RepID=UPI0029B9913F|nr:hypothetical protein [Streptomyces stelliscabiei]MDX2515474.1 hypothetical protein [Streptomyces stelliscabiei]
MSREPSNDEQGAAQRSVERAFPAVAAFLASADARPDADLMRVDAPQVSGPRTVTVRLLNTPGATMTVTCPEWCASDHAEDIAHGTFAEDFAHRAAEEALHVDLGDGGAEDVLMCEITQYPFGSTLRTPTVVMWPTLGMTEAHLDPRGLFALADQLRTYADALDEVAVTLDEIRRSTPGGLR